MIKYLYVAKKNIDNKKEEWKGFAVMYKKRKMKGFFFIQTLLNKIITIIIIFVLIWKCTLYLSKDFHFIVFIIVCLKVCCKFIFTSVFNISRIALK